MKKDIDFNISELTGSGKLILREEIDEKYKWNIEDIFPDLETWEAEFNWIENAIGEFSKFENKLNESPQQLFSCFKFEEEVGIKLGKVFLYSMLKKDLDLTDSNSHGMYDRVISLHAKISEATSFIRPELQSFNQEELENFINAEPSLEIYRHMFEDLFRQKPNTLPKEQERILAMATPVTGVPYDAFSLLENADLKFPIVKDEDNNDIEISHGRYASALFSNNREYRKRVYKAFYEPIIDHKNTLAALFNGNIKGLLFNAKARNYRSTLEAALMPNNISTEIYDNLISTVNANIHSLHRWVEIKKRYLKLDSFHPYDSYVTLFPSVQKSFSYNEAVDIVLESLKPMGEDYIKNLQRAFDERWVDVYETKHKRSGAYSSGTTFGVHPFVLLNWNNNLNDVFTLAHEMGHCLHSFYSVSSQPYVYADYTIFLAEVASTTNESLLLDYLISKAESKDEKLYLMEKFLLNAVTTFFRQTRFAEFEKSVHQKMTEGMALTPDYLCELYGNLYQKGWGSVMEMDEEETYTWARVPHFYYNFYVYQYATGFSAAETLAQNIKSGEKQAIDNYLGFLKAGNSKYSLDILKNAGVDMRKPDPVLSVITKMNKILDELEVMLK